MDRLRPTDRVHVIETGERGFICSYAAPDDPVRVCLDSGQILTFLPTQVKREPNTPDQNGTEGGNVDDPSGRSH